MTEYLRKKIESLLAQGQYDPAAELLEEILKYSPKDREAGAMLNFCRAKSGVNKVLPDTPAAAASGRTALWKEIGVIVFFFVIYPVLCCASVIMLEVMNCSALFFYGVFILYFVTTAYYFYEGKSHDED